MKLSNGDALPKNVKEYDECEYIQIGFTHYENRFYPLEGGNDKELIAERSKVKFEVNEYGVLPEYRVTLLSTLQEPMVLVEQRLDFSHYVPDGFGTGDCVIVAENVLTVIDFKYGKGVAVSADHNSQMMLYALGALELFDALYDIAEIRMVIFQPRIQNLSECTLSLSKLLHWAETELKPKAALAAKGDGDFCAGEHCRFCKVKATCRKRAEYNLQLAKYDFAMPDKLLRYLLPGLRRPLLHLLL